MSTICELCEENEVWPEAAAHGKNWCHECSHIEDCQNEYHGRAGGSAPLHPFWETDRDLCWCEKCRDGYTKTTELDALESLVKSLANEHEWGVVDQHRADTGSVYIELHRECDTCILGSDEDCSCETLKVRISDHGSCYCTEDISLVIPSGNPSGDDHSVEYFQKRLVRVPKGEN